MSLFSNVLDLMTTTSQDFHENLVSREILQNDEFNILGALLSGSIFLTFTLRSS